MNNGWSPTDVLLTYSPLPTLPGIQPWKIATQAVGEAMGRYGKGKMHFIRRSENVEVYRVSKTVDNIVNNSLKVPFMI